MKCFASLRCYVCKVIYSEMAKIHIPLSGPCEHNITTDDCTHLFLLLLRSFIGLSGVYLIGIERDLFTYKSKMSFLRFTICKFIFG